MQWYDQRVCSKRKCGPLLADDWCCDKCQCDSICGNISVSGCWDLGLRRYLQTDRLEAKFLHLERCEAADLVKGGRKQNLLVRWVP